MVNQVYLALYKHKRSWRKEPWKAFADAVTRCFTKGDYSHCELVVERREFTRGSHYDNEVVYDCYSSSVQDGGVRCKQINVRDGKWDLVLIPSVTESQIKAYFNQTKGQAYDWRGALGVILGIKEKRSKYFCSEWCFNAVMNSKDGWRFSPNQLATIFKKGK